MQTRRPILATTKPDLWKRQLIRSSDPGQNVGRIQCSRNMVAFHISSQFLYRSHSVCHEDVEFEILGMICVGRSEDWWTFQSSRCYGPRANFHPNPIYFCRVVKETPWPLWLLVQEGPPGHRNEQQRPEPIVGRPWSRDLETIKRTAPRPSPDLMQDQEFWLYRCQCPKWA